MYSITLKDNPKAISMPLYHASPEKRADINKRINEWFLEGVIRESESTWGAPVIIVYHNGKAHMCIDY